MQLVRYSAVLLTTLLCSLQNVSAADTNAGMAGTVFSPSETFFDKQSAPLVIELGAGYTDNYNPLLESDIKSSVLSATAKGTIVTQQEAYWFEAKYLAQTHQFQLSNNQIDQSDDYNTLDVGIKNRLFLDKRWSVDLNLNYTNFDERIGTGISKFRPGITNNDAANIGQISANITYGADREYRSIQFTVVKSLLDYDDNNSYSNSFDLVQDVFIAYSNFRITEQTQLIGMLEYRQVTYDFGPSLDSNAVKALVGAEWLPSGKSKVLALVGAYQRSYDDLDSTSGINWELAADLYPREDILVNFGSKRNSTAGENNELSFDTIEEEHVLKVLYHFSEQWQFGFSGKLRQLEYQEFERSTQSDELTYGVSSQLSLTDHSRVNIVAGTNKLEDQSRDVDFTQNSVRVTWQYEF